MPHKLKDLILVSLIFVLSAIGLLDYVPYLAQRIEIKLKQEIQQTLQAQDMNWVEVSVTGRDVTLEGTASNSQSYNQVIHLIAEIHGIRQLNNQIKVQLERITPYRLNLELHNQQIHLTGYAPDEQYRQALQEKLQQHFAQYHIENTLALAAGEPSDWHTALNLIFAQLPQVQDARLEIVNYDVRLSGVVETEVIAEQLKQQFKTLQNYHYVPYLYLQVAEELPIQSPYSFTLNYQNNRLQVTGYVADAQTQQLIETKLADLFTQASPEIQLQLASGAPDAWQPMLLLMLEQLNQFQSIRLEIINYTIRLVGVTQTTPQLEQVTQALASLKNQHYQLYLYLNAADEKQPLQRVNPYTFIADYQRQILHVSGYVPRLEDRQTLITSTRKLFGNKGFVEEGITLASGEPAHWLQAINLLLPALQKFEQGRLEISNYEIRLTGTVATTETANALQKLPAQLLKYNYLLQLYVYAADSQERLCQAKFNTLLEKNNIEFDSNSAIIKGSSYALLNELIAVMQSCPKAKITIAGYTDNIGNPDKNLQLSQQRADAVKNYLIHHGFSATQFKSIGYGKAHPIADNATLAGRARNRRIEFRIQGY